MTSIFFDGLETKEDRVGNNIPHVINGETFLPPNFENMTLQELREYKKKLESGQINL